VAPPSSLLHQARTLLTALTILIGLTPLLSTAQERALPDSVAAMLGDTLHGRQAVRAFLPAIGSLRGRLDSTDALNSSQYLWTDAKYPGDLLWKAAGLFVRELGEIGQPGQLNAFGIDGRGVSLQLDGRPLNDPVTGTYNLYDIPLEYVEQIEVLTIPHSLFSGPNAPAGAINFVTHQYDNVRPMTKIRYLQGPFNHILSDGIFAQDVARGVNVMVGFQRQVSDGRYPNAAYDSWNVRTRVRYNPSDRLNVWLGDFYNKSTIGFNGGVDAHQSPSLYDEVTAVVKSRASGQTSSRRDVTLGAVARILPDSSETSHVTGYYTTIDRDYREGDDPLSPPILTDTHRSSFWGVKLRQLLAVPLGQVQVGYEIERRMMNESRTIGRRLENYWAATGGANLQFGELISTDLDARLERLRNESSLSLGVEFKRRLESWMGFSLGYSRAYRLPTLQELYWTDSTVVRSGPIGRERHSLLEAGLWFRAGRTFDWSISLFNRTISDAIVFRSFSRSGTFPGVEISSSPKVALAGATSSLTARAWNFELLSSLTYITEKEQDTLRLPVPKLTLVNEFSYRNTFVGGHLDAKFAVRWRLMTKQDGLYFVPAMLAFASQNDLRVGTFSSVDLYGAAKIGSTYLTLIWENPLDIGYFETPIYPMPGRNIKLSVNWAFTD
jgi:outer membrane cobalamin receptor